MIRPTLDVCPQCHQPEDIIRTCRACGYAYPASRPHVWVQVLRMGFSIVVGVAVVMLVFVVAATFLRWVMLPFLSLIFRV